MKRIIVIGLNPSKQSPDLSAFHPATRSGSRIRKWMDGIDNVEYHNIFQYKVIFKYDEDALYRLYRLLGFDLIDGMDMLIYTLIHGDDFSAAMFNSEGMTLMDLKSKSILIKDYKFIIAGTEAYKEFKAMMPHIIDDAQILNIPHPSGRNRKFNIPGFEQQVIETIKDFCK